MLATDILMEASDEAEDITKLIMTRGEPCAGVTCTGRELTFHMGCSAGPCSYTYGEVKDFIKKMKIDELAAAKIGDRG